MNGSVPPLCPPSAATPPSFGSTTSVSIGISSGAGSPTSAGSGAMIVQSIDGAQSTAGSLMSHGAKAPVLHPSGGQLGSTHSVAPAAHFASVLPKSP
jgi:hypothetical protein